MIYQSIYNGDDQSHTQSGANHDTIAAYSIGYSCPIKFVIPLMNAFSILFCFITLNNLQQLSTKLYD